MFIYKEYNFTLRTFQNKSDQEKDEAYVHTKIDKICGEPLVK